MDDFIEINLSEEEANATWARLLGEDPAPTQPAKPTATSATPIARRVRVPKVGTAIQRSGRQVERKLLELACMPPPPPRRPPRPKVQPTTGVPPWPPLTRPRPRATPRVREIRTLRHRVTIHPRTAPELKEIPLPPTPAANPATRARTNTGGHREVTVAPGVTLLVPTRVIHHTRRCRLVEGGVSWRLRFNNDGSLRTAQRE